MDKETKKMGKVGVIGGVVGGALVEAAHQLSGYVGEIPNKGGALKKFAKETTQSATQGLKGALESMASAARTTGDKISELGKETSKNISEIASNAANAANDFSSAAGDLKDWISSNVQSGASTAGKLADRIINGIDSLGTSTAEVLTNGLNKTQNVINTNVSDLANGFSEAGELLGEAGSDFKHITKDTTSHVVDSLKDTKTQGQEITQKTFDNATEVANNISLETKNVETQIQEQGNSALSELSEVKNEVGSWFGDKFNSGVEVIKSGLNSLGQVPGKLVNAFDDACSNLQSAGTELANEAMSLGGQVVQYTNEGIDLIKEGAVSAFALAATPFALASEAVGPALNNGINSLSTSAMTLASEGMNLASEACQTFIDGATSTQAIAVACYAIFGCVFYLAYSKFQEKNNSQVKGVDLEKAKEEEKMLEESPVASAKIFEQEREQRVQEEERKRLSNRVKSVDGSYKKSVPSKHLLTDGLKKSKDKELEL